MRWVCLRAWRKPCRKMASARGWSPQPQLQDRLMSTPSRTLERWRLVLGRFAKQQLPANLSRQQRRMEAALDYLYAREYRGRGLREENDGRTGGDEASQFTIPKWLSEVRTLFPKETVEIIEKHALDRYDMKELVTDAQTLAKLEPNLDLLKTLLSFRGHLKGAVLDQARRIIRHVVEEIRQRWESEVRQALAGKLNRFRHSPLKVAQNFDWRTTLRRTSSTTIRRAKPWCCTSRSSSPATRATCRGTSSSAWTRAAAWPRV